VNGHPVQLFVRDEGDNASAAATGVQQLLEDDVDAIIGPASSNITVAVLPTIATAGVVDCSPSASTIGLDDFPDNHLFFRTIPSDSLQAEAMAKVIEQTGETSASIGYVNDGYGQPFQTDLLAALLRRRISVTTAIGYSTAANDFAGIADRLLRPGGGAVAVIGDRDAGARLLGALAQATGATPRDIVVNDSLRQPWSLGLLASVNSAERAHIVGVSQDVLTTDPVLLGELTRQSPTATGLFAGPAYDCANIIMLAAVQAGSTRPSAIAALITDVTSGGSRCVTFAACRALLADKRNINYDGPGGQFAIGADGDPESGVFDQFGFGADGRDITTNTVNVSYPP